MSKSLANSLALLQQIKTQLGEKEHLSRNQRQQPGRVYKTENTQRDRKSDKFQERQRQITRKQRQRQRQVNRQQNQYQSLKTKSNSLEWLQQMKRDDQIGMQHLLDDIDRQFEKTALKLRGFRAQK